MIRKLQSSSSQLRELQIKKWAKHKWEETFFGEEQWIFYSKNGTEFKNTKFHIRLTWQHQKKQNNPRAAAGEKMKDESATKVLRVLNFSQNHFKLPQFFWHENLLSLKYFAKMFSIFPSFLYFTTLSRFMMKELIYNHNRISQQKIRRRRRRIFLKKVISTNFFQFRQGRLFFVLFIIKQWKYMKTNSLLK